MIRAVPAAIAAGALVGALEGLVYPESGTPRAPLFAYWAALVVILVGLSAGFQRAHKPTHYAGAMLALPVAVVAQDAVSRVLRSHTFASHPWEVAVFGDHWLTRADLGIPGWYVPASLLPLLALLLLHYMRPNTRAPDLEVTTA